MSKETNQTIPLREADKNAMFLARQLASATFEDGVEVNVRLSNATLLVVVGDRTFYVDVQDLLAAVDRARKEAPDANP